MRTLTVVLVAALSVAVAAAPRKKPPPPDRSPEHIAELIAKLEGGSMGERVRASKAYKELTRIGRAAVPQLVAAANGDKPWVRVWAAAALASTRDPRAVEPLLKVLEDPLAEARMIATWHGAGLHNLDKRIAPAIVRRLADSAASVRQWAEKAIRERIKFRGILDDLQKMTSSDSAFGRTSAFKLLMGHRHQDPADTIGKALSEEKDWRIRSAAVRCLGEGVMRPHQPMFDLLFRALDDESEEVKADAVQIMEHVLKETADQMPRDMRKQITDKLEKKLPPMLDAKLSRLRGASLYLLSAGERDKLFDRAFKATDDPSPDVRSYALRTLARCGVKNDKVVQKAVSLLDDDTLEVRRYAFRLLGWAAGGKFDYKPEDPPEKRAEAIKQIKARLDKASRR